jgi:hypothetical protein
MPTPRLETLTARVTATALLTEVLLQPGIVVSTASAIVPPGVVCDFTAPVQLDPAKVSNVGLSEPQELKLQEPEAEWSKRMEKRFEQLSISEAFGRLSSGERDELENLTKERRRLHHPRTAEEILFEYQQRKVTSELVKAVQKYVNFHDLPDQARAATR